MTDARRRQRQFGDPFIAEAVADLQEPWMREADRLLQDDTLVAAVHAALHRRWPRSATRGPTGTPAEVVLRLLILKHLRNWSYAVLEREVRTNLLYRTFTRVGGDKVPDAKTMAKWGTALGSAVVAELHQRRIAIAREAQVIEGRKMRLDTTVVETNIHYPTDSSLLGDGVRVLSGCPGDSRGHQAQRRCRAAGGARGVAPAAGDLRAARAAGAPPSAAHDETRHGDRRPGRHAIARPQPECETASAGDRPHRAHEGCPAPGACDAVCAWVTTARQAVSPLHHADAAFTTGAPALAVLEPALLLFPLARGALRGSIRNADPGDSLRMRGVFIGGRIERGVGGDEPRRSPQHMAVEVNGRHQQIRVAGALVVDLVVNDDLVLRLLELHQLPEFVGFARFALPNDLGGRLKEAEQLVLDARLAAQDARPPATSDAKVLITGESGVGKEIVARVVHQRSARMHSPLITINCAGVPDSLLESELFGHVKGSFTGAYRDKRGWLETAHGGTIFMDEVGEMSLRMQAMLLRFLETGEIQRVGSDRHGSPLDVRVITATHIRLLDAIADKTFREDLYYRLNVVHVEIPPLRERREDIPVLLHHFLRVFGDSYRRPVPELTDEALTLLTEYHWPGNVRELKNITERLVLKCRTGSVEADMLPSVVMRDGKKSADTGKSAPPSEPPIHEELFARIVQGGVTFWSGVYEPFMTHDLTRRHVRELIRLGLEHTRGNYKTLVTTFNMPPDDYKKFLSFLRKYQCGVPFQGFRMLRSGLSAQPRRDTTGATGM